METGSMEENVLDFEKLARRRENTVSRAKVAGIDGNSPIQ